MKALLSRPPSFYVALATALAVGGAFAYAEVFSGGWRFLHAHLVSRATGWCALAALVLTLAATPLARLAGTHAVHIRRSRRALGIAAALLASLHAALALAGPLDGAWEATLSWPYLRAGLVALVILLALLLTSFPRLTRALRVRVWKPLHRLSYAAGALALLHIYLGPYAPRRAVLAVAATLCIALAARLVPRRRAKRTPKRAQAAPSTRRR